MNNLSRSAGEIPGPLSDTVRRTTPLAGSDRVSTTIAGGSPSGPATAPPRNIEGKRWEQKKVTYTRGQLLEQFKKLADANKFRGYDTAADGVWTTRRGNQLIMLNTTVRRVAPGCVSLEDGRAVWHAPLGRRYDPGPAPPDDPDPRLPVDLTAVVDLPFIILTLIVIWIIGGMVVLVPALMVLFLRSGRRLRPETENPVARLFGAMYRPVLRLALRWRWATLLVNFAIVPLTIPLCSAGATRHSMRACDWQCMT